MDLTDKLRVPEHNAVRNSFHTVLTLIEELIQRQQINADVDRIYLIIERVAEYRSVSYIQFSSSKNSKIPSINLFQEDSVKNLLQHKFKNISVMRPNWLKNLREFVERFYKTHPNPNIRMKTIEYLKEAIEGNRTGYEEEILEKVVIVLFSDVHLESDIKIRTSVCSMILEVCLHCDTKRCSELLEILEKVLNRPFDTYALNGTSVTECEDLLIVVNGLIDLFLEKLHRLPSSNAIKIFYIMVSHLERHYSNQIVFGRAKNVRYNIINWMLKVRANSAFQIGYPYPKLISNNFKFSYFLGIEGEFQLPPSSSGATTGGQLENEDKYSSTNSTLSIKRGCKIIVKVLMQETDWSILQLLLRELPKIMQNKTLIQGNDIDMLAKAMGDLYLSVMGINKAANFKFADTSSKPNSGDFRALMIPAMSSIFTYNCFLEARTKRFITDLLKSEIKMDSNRNVLSICIQTFTILLMEKCESFERSIADVLLAISKVSDTVSVSIPILEFMSTITHLPYGFTNLNQKQFSYVFATCLPYTNPIRYDHYTVCLAHQIIARWFLKSRLQWRKKYADYIIEGIAKNIQKSDIVYRPDHDLKALVNEDSSNRKRSSSLTEQGYKRRDRDSHSILQKTKELKQRQENMSNFNINEFHLELIETCYDFMTRHTFSLASALPKRMPTADFLLKGGQQQSWIVENSVITITTSGCSSNPVKNGLCERCNSVCKLQQSRNSLDSIRRSKDELNSEGTSVGSKAFSPFSQFSNSTSNPSMCACCCVGWAEIFIRRPTGNISWIMKIQNSVSFGSSYADNSLHDLTALFSQFASDESEFDEDSKSTISSNQIPMSTPEPVKSNENIARRMTGESIQSSTAPIDIPNQRSNDFESENGGDPGDPDNDVSFDDDSDSRSRNPVRRVNSSPEMSSNWKNNFSNKGQKHDPREQEDSGTNEPIIEESQQKKKSKETKVSCEAIPEEIPMASSAEESYERPQLFTSISAVETTNAQVVPKKQFSADDTLQLRKETSFNTEPKTLSSAFGRNMELQKVISKPPHFPQPLSPKILYKSSKQTSMIDGGANEDSSNRMRSQTISVIGRDLANRELKKNGDYLIIVYFRKM